MVLAAGKTVKSVRGQFGSHRMTEYSWRNTSGNPERVGIRARALAGDRELAAARTEFLGERSLLVGFGRCATPESSPIAEAATPMTPPLSGSSSTAIEDQGPPARLPTA